MNIRQEFEQREERFISPWGCASSRSRGRAEPEEASPIRTVFQQDRDRIVFSNAFRRLKHKTQVFLSPLGDHYRTRLTHALEVSQIARTIARAMRLNEDLVEAIALGHDLGHTPFGHSGETVLKEIYSRGFSHHAQSLRVVDLLENSGKGLNLTYEVRDGILKHSKGQGRIIPEVRRETACTLEGRIVRVADIMAYLNHDLDDAIRSGVIDVSQVPETCLRHLGHTHSKRATTMIQDLVYTSESRGDTMHLRLSDCVLTAMMTLREFLFQKVYRSAQVHREFTKARKVLSELYTYFLADDRMLKTKLAELEMAECYRRGHSRKRIVCDFIASMTDRYALDLYAEIFLPAPQV